MSRITDAPEFDVCGDLPTGVTVLEASAGTGKTYAIAAMATRYVADGIPLGELLLVTFGRMATGELRERVRGQLSVTEEALRRVLAGDDAGTEDPIVTLLSNGQEDEIEERCLHLSRALSDFDSATIATTHGFCQGVLDSIGMAADVDPATTFADNLSDLLEEVVDDLYVRKWHARDAPKFSRQEALQIARIAIANPLAPVEPTGLPDDHPGTTRMRLALAARAEMERRKRAGRLMTYDDLLLRVREALIQQSMVDVGARLRARHRIVLIDEFQDTDPVQWEIVRTAFDTAEALILVGDPKQAIYGFRGADVYSYLEAAESAATRATLRTNWRSDQPLIDAYDQLFANARLGEEGILYRRVTAAKSNEKHRLSGAQAVTPLRIRMVDREAETIEQTQGGFANKPSAREHVAKDTAADIVRLLNSGAEIASRTDGKSKTVMPGDIAVLVRTHRQAAMVREELEAVGVPGVINGAGSVFATTAAREWLRLLEAVERPTSAQRVRSVALTSFFGWSAERLADSADEDWEVVHGQIHRWAGILRTQGVASLMASINVEEEMPARILGQVNGERQLTDLRHIAQLLHQESLSEGMGAAALTDWMQQRIEEAESDTADEERSRRLESDAEAVQILTIHRSKGLEFPIVYCPFLWDPAFIDDDSPIYFHDPDAGNVRTIDVGVGTSASRAHRNQHLVEQRGEELRLMYVALTRAQAQCVIWWAATYDAGHSPLCRLLFAKDEDGTVLAAGPDRPPGDDVVRDRLEALRSEAPHAIAVEDATLETAAYWESRADDVPALSLATFERDIDWAWRRASFSSITAGHYEATVASEPSQQVLADEPSDASAPAPSTGSADDDGLEGTPSLFAGLPVGVEFGTLVHRVLERVDFAAPDLESELAGAIERMDARASGADHEQLSQALASAISTPLGPLVGGLSLRDLGPSERLDELDFELPLAGGDRPTGDVRLSAISDILARFGDDRVKAYAPHLTDPNLNGSIHGYLTGSIDLVGRIDGDQPRFFIVDYKTNWLAPPGEDLTAWHYRPDAMYREMARHHYLLQGTLYSAAVHRYLRWRLPAYDPAVNFAGVLYLFLRGMTGANAPVTDGHATGVFSWRPSNEALDALSAALEEGVK